MRLDGLEMTIELFSLHVMLVHISQTKFPFNKKDQLVCENKKNVPKLRLKYCLVAVFDSTGH